MALRVIPLNQHNNDYLVVSAVYPQAESVDALQLLWTRIKSQSQQGEPPGGDFPIPDVRVVMGVANGAHSDDEIMQWCVREGIELIRWERDEECSEPQTQDCGRRMFSL